LTLLREKFREPAFHAFVKNLFFDKPNLFIGKREFYQEKSNLVYAATLTMLLSR